MTTLLPALAAGAGPVAGSEAACSGEAGAAAGGSDNSSAGGTRAGSDVTATVATLSPSRAKIPMLNAISNETISAHTAAAIQAEIEDGKRASSRRPAWKHGG